MRLHVEAGLTPFVVAGAGCLHQGVDGRVGDTGRDVPEVHILVAGLSALHLPTGEDGKGPVFILELGIEGQVVTGGELKALVLVVTDRVTVVVVLGVVPVLTIVATIDPVHGAEVCGQVLVGGRVVDVQLDVALVVELPVVVVLAQELVVDGELRSQVVLVLLVPTAISVGHGVAVHEHVAQLVAGVMAVVIVREIERQHIEVATRRQVGEFAVDILCHQLVDAHVRHGGISATEDVVGVVLVVGGEGQADV